MLFLETLNIHHTSKLMQSVQASLKDNHREGAFYKLKATNCMPRATHQGDMAECTIQPKILQVRWEIMLYLPNHCIPPHPINDFLFHIDLRLDPLLKKGSSLELTGKGSDYACPEHTLSSNINTKEQLLCLEVYWEKPFTPFLHEDYGLCFALWANLVQLSLADEHVQHGAD